MNCKLYICFFFPTIAFINFTISQTREHSDRRNLGLPINHTMFEFVVSGTIRLQMYSQREYFEQYVKSNPAHYHLIIINSIFFFLPSDLVHFAREFGDRKKKNSSRRLMTILESRLNNVLTLERVTTNFDPAELSLFSTRRTLWRKRQPNSIIQMALSFLKSITPSLPSACV